jgi:sugar (pentulose or hexulose) kinase
MLILGLDLSTQSLTAVIIKQNDVFDGTGVYDIVQRAAVLYDTELSRKAPQDRIFDL